MITSWGALRRRGEVARTTWSRLSRGLQLRVGGTGGVYQADLEAVVTGRYDRARDRWDPSRDKWASKAVIRRPDPAPDATRKGLELIDCRKPTATVGF